MLEQLAGSKLVFVDPDVANIFTGVSIPFSDWKACEGKVDQATAKARGLTRAQYYHMVGAKQDQFKGDKFYELLDKNKRRYGWSPPEVRQAYKDLSENGSTHVGGTEKALEAAKNRIEKLAGGPVWKFVSSRTHAQLRFQRTKRKQRAMDTLVHTLAPGKNDVVVMGDWFGCRALKGEDRATPVKSFRRTLQKTPKARDHARVQHLVQMRSLRARSRARMREGHPPRTATHALTHGLRQGGPEEGSQTLERIDPGRETKVAVRRSQDQRSLDVPSLQEKLVARCQRVLQLQPRQRAMDKLAPGKHDAVVMGDWFGRRALKGEDMATPVTSFRRNLQKQRRLPVMQEYNSSCKCASCGPILGQACPKVDHPRRTRMLTDKAWNKVILKKEEKISRELSSKEKEELRFVDRRINGLAISTRAVISATCSFTCAHTRCVQHICADQRRTQSLQQLTGGSPARKKSDCASEDPKVGDRPREILHQA